MGNEMAEYFEDPEFIQNLTYLANVFTALNELNRSLQGQGISVIHACEKLSAFKKKLQLYIRRVKKRNLVNFPSLQETLEESASCIHPLFQQLLNIYKYLVLHLMATSHVERYKPVTTGSVILSR